MTVINPFEQFIDCDPITQIAVNTFDANLHEAIANIAALGEYDDRNLGTIRDDVLKSIRATIPPSGIEGFDDDLRITNAIDSAIRAKVLFVF